MEQVSGVSCNVEGPVARITLTAATRQNRLDWPAISAMHEFVREVIESETARVLVFDAEGKDFCAGDCWPEMGEWPRKYTHRKPGGSHGSAPLPLIDLLGDLRSIGIPAIAVLQGEVSDAGLDLACHCDIRLAADNAVFQDKRVESARFSATGITYVLPRLVGLSNAARILMFGERIDAIEAARIGLVYKTVAADRLQKDAQALIEAVSGMATRSFGLVKQQVTEQLDMNYRTALMHSMAVRQTNIFEDREEGQRAFIEKRPPQYTGR